MAKRIGEAALSFHDALVWATKAPVRAEALGQADFHLERLEVFNRLAMKSKLLSFGRHLAAPDKVNSNIGFRSVWDTPGDLAARR